MTGRFQATEFHRPLSCDEFDDMTAVPRPNAVFGSRELGAVKLTYQECSA